MYKVLVLGLVAAVACNDVIIGNEVGRKIFDNKIEASPTLWQQRQNVTVNATSAEVISRIVVTDNRPLKDGIARIVEGGEGQKNATIELQSPAVFRGFDFKIEIYAVPENVDAPYNPVLTRDTSINAQAQPDANSTDSVPHVHTEIQPPVITAEGARPNRQVDPVVQYVGDNTTQLSTELPSTGMSEATDATGTTEKGTEATDKMSEASTTEGLSTAESVSTTAVPTTEGASTTVATSSESTETTEAAPANLQRFDGISRELGQRVIFGLTRN